MATAPSATPSVLPSPRPPPTAQPPALTHPPTPPLQLPPILHLQQGHRLQQQRRWLPKSPCPSQTPVAALATVVAVAAGLESAVAEVAAAPAGSTGCQPLVRLRHSQPRRPPRRLSTLSENWRLRYPRNPLSEKRHMPFPSSHLSEQGFLRYPRSRRSEMRHLRSRLPKQPY